MDNLGYDVLTKMVGQTGNDNEDDRGGEEDGNLQEEPDVPEDDPLDEILGLVSHLLRPSVRQAAQGRGDQRKTEDLDQYNRQYEALDPVDWRPPWSNIGEV